MLRFLACVYPAPLGLSCQLFAGAQPQPHMAMAELGGHQPCESRAGPGHQEGSLAGARGEMAKGGLVVAWADERHRPGCGHGSTAEEESGCGQVALQPFPLAGVCCRLGPCCPPLALCVLTGA